MCLHESQQLPLRLMKSSNLFIALEGIDGSGKSTQIQLLRQRLENDGHQVYVTREPTPHETGKLIRAVFNHQVIADQHTIAALFVADRLQHILDEEHGLLKKLAEGFTVISDRYYFSSYAYHSVFVDMDWVIQLNSKCASLLRPDLNLFIDVNPDEAYKRILSARASTELYETLDNLKKVKANYLKAFEKLKDQERVAVVEGNRSVDQVSDDLYYAIKNLHN